MSQNGIFPMNQRDLLRQLSAILHTTTRDDVKVQIQFLVNFSVDEETYVNTVLDPWQPLSRVRLRELVGAVLEKLGTLEAEAAAERKATGVLLPGIQQSVPELAPPLEEIVPEYNQSPGG